MPRNLFKKAACFLLALNLSCNILCAHAATLPDAVQDETASSNVASRTIVLSGGCFWGVQEVFQHVRGVEKVVSGYAGGTAETAHYDIVGGGDTGHAESVEITYNPQVISVGKLLKVFFAVAHNPTELNYQGADTGTQYRSAIFFTTVEQEKTAKAYIGQLDNAKAFPAPIVTTVQELEAFYPAEAYHQDYARLHPEDPYIVFNDLPKVAALKREFLELYKD